MSFATRKILPAVEEIFARYNSHKLGGRLKREEAVRMFRLEYDLTDIEAVVLFRIFDQDQNDELSAWEFQKFYVLLAQDVKQVFSLYERLSIDSLGKRADIEHTFDALIEMKTPVGRQLQEQEVERFIMTASGSEKYLDLEKFLNLMCMVKLVRD